MNVSEEKPFYKIGEVCERTGTQPYVLRFWESEFPALAPRKNRSGQRVYRQRDIDLIQRIKTLLYDQEYTIAGARKVLEAENDQAGEEGGESRLGPSSESGGDESSLSRGHGRGAGADGGNGGRHGTPAASAAERAVVTAAAHDRLAESQLEVEVKNLRAKLAHVEGELRSLLDEMDRRDKR